MAEVIFNLNTYGAKAEEDMVNAEAVIPRRIGTPRGGAFWCEQAIEKYFKHLLAQQVCDDLTTRHKLLSLATEAGYNCSATERIILRELGQMYYERYPVSKGEEIPEDPTWEDVDQIYALAVKIRSWAMSITAKRSGGIRSSLNRMKLI